MSTERLDIEAVRKHLLPALRTTVRATLKQALEELEEARKWIADNKQIAELDKKLLSCFVSLPKHWPSRYNANGEPCDMIDGPCSCGGWHSIYDKWVQNNMEKYGLKK